MEEPTLHAAEMPGDQQHAEVINSTAFKSTAEMKMYAKYKKASKSMKILAISQMFLAIWIALFGIICFGDGLTKFPPACIDGSGIWIGVFSIVTAAIGLRAAFHIQGKCLTAYLVLAVLAAIGNGILFILAAQWLTTLSAYQKYDAEGLDFTRGYGYGTPLAMNSLMLLLSLVQMICLIISCSLMCYRGRFKGQPGVNCCSCCSCCCCCPTEQDLAFAAGYMPVNANTTQDSGANPQQDSVPRIVVE